MILDYYSLLCPEPIRLSIGSIKNPTLREIGNITYKRFGIYQVYLKLTPDDYYKQINKEKLPYWESLSNEQKADMTTWDLVTLEPDIAQGYLEVFSFFFIERVIFREGVFVIVETNDKETPDDELDINENNLRGIIHHNTFMEVLDILQQICCLKSYGEEETPTFKNEKARRLYERMLKAKEEQERINAKRNASNYSLPNIISSVASKSKNMNIIEIWDATLFQLYDQFNKLRADDIHYLNTVRVSVWGDEKGKYDDSLWYKNQYNKSNSGLL